MKTLMSDVSRVALLRKRLVYAGTSMKVIGLLSAIMASADTSNHIGTWGAIAFGILLLWFSFRLSNHLRLGETSTAIFIALWTMVYFLVLGLFAFLPMVLKDKIDFYSVISFVFFFFLPIYFVIRGLLDLRAYKSWLASNPSKFETFTLNPWEDKGKVARKHPRFLNKSSIIAYFFVLIVPLPWLIMTAVGLIEKAPSESDPAFLFGYYMATFAIDLSIWLLMIALYRRGRRHAMLPGNKLLKKDNRDVILYLRAFHDDRTIKIRARANDGRIFLERFVKISFEEFVTDHMWRYGPVIAIGDPRTKSKLAPLGAVRDFERDDTWQQKATELMQQASIIVAVVGQTEGLLWEIDTIIKLGFKSKLILLLPPVTTQDLKARCDSLVHHVKGAEFPQNIDLTHTLALIFPEDQVGVITADERNDWTYETVLDNAAQLILAGKETKETAGSALDSGQGKE